MAVVADQPIPAFFLPERTGIAVRAPDFVRGHENIEWSIGYAFHLTDANQRLPRVLLVGDSICNGYQGEVQKALEGLMSVSYWVSSYCVTSPRYLKLLEFYLEESPYEVVHFNNGLHSLGTPDAAWESGFRSALRLIKEKQPRAKIVFTTSTPLKDVGKTAKAKALKTRLFLFLSFHFPCCLHPRISVIL